VQAKRPARSCRRGCLVFAAAGGRRRRGAGGHLAQFLGATAGVPQFEGEGNLDQSSAVSCVVNFFGPSDFTKSYDKSVDAKEVLPLFFGGDLSAKRKEHIIGSPLYWVTPNAAPTLCLHVTADEYLALEQATWLVDKLKAATVEAELVAFEGAGHWLKGVPTEKTDGLMIDFFDRHFKPTGRRFLVVVSAVGVTERWRLAVDGGSATMPASAIISRSRSLAAARSWSSSCETLPLSVKSQLGPPDMVLSNAGVYGAPVAGRRGMRCTLEPAIPGSPAVAPDRRGTLEAGPPAPV
jgi:hypothetical protein